MRERARPSPWNQARVVSETLALAERENFKVNIIEAFDQPWKRALEGAVGGYWGIFDRATDGLKFRFGGTVSDHPHWPWQAAAGIALAALSFGGAFAAGPQKGLFPAICGRSIGAVAFFPPCCSAGPLRRFRSKASASASWLRSLAFAATAGVAPVVCAMACAAGRAVPAFASFLGPPPQAPLTASIGCSAAP